MQVDKRTKKIINAQIILGDFDSDASNSDYTLSFKYQALGFFGLMNRFAFTLPVYFVTFMSVGLINVGLAVGCS